MNHVSFYGASDDLVEVEGDVPGADEYPEERAVFEIAGLRVLVNFTNMGTWMVGVGQVDEDVPVVAENIALSVKGYTMVLDMDVPEGAYVSKVAADAL